jgi:hypothetical protein
VFTARGEKELEYCHHRSGIYRLLLLHLLRSTRRLVPSTVPKHQLSAPHQDRRRVLRLLLLDRPCRELLNLLLQRRDLVVPQPLDREEVRHREVVETRLPREVLRDVRADEVVADVESGGVAFSRTDVDEVVEEFVSDVGRGGGGGGFDGVLEELVLLRERDGDCEEGDVSIEKRKRRKKERLTIPLRVLLVEMGGKTAELEELVLLEAGGETEGVESVVGVDRVAEGLVILLLDEQIVERLVDSRDVVLR